MQRREVSASRASLLTTANATGRRTSGGLSTASEKPSAVAHASSAKCAVKSTSEKTVVTRKVDELLKRMLPHSIVQTYDKVSAALKMQVNLSVNGDALRPIEEEQGPLSAQWRAQHDAGVRKTGAPSRPFHYARSIQYEMPHPELSLNESFKTLQVTMTSVATNATVSWFQSPSPALTKKSWRLIAETDRRIGLALYELPLGPWKASSLVVLVWAKTLEVVNIYLQLHIAELLYGCPPRALRILPDDVDTRYGLHSFTVAITIRDFARVIWETESYSVEFPSPEESRDSVAVGLLNEEAGYRDRGRFITIPVTTAIATDAITIGLESAIVVDLTVWATACQPVWAFSRLLQIITREATREVSDFSLSVAGDKRQLSEIAFRDEVSGNSLAVQLEKSYTTSTGARNAPKNVFVKQITVELATAFLNKTFGTNYATKAKTSMRS